MLVLAQMSVVVVGDVGVGVGVGGCRWRLLKFWWSSSGDGEFKGWSVPSNQGRLSLNPGGFNVGMTVTIGLTLFKQRIAYAR